MKLLVASAAGAVQLSAGTTELIELGNISRAYGTLGFELIVQGHVSSM